MSNLKMIKISTDFSDIPAGRYRADGPNSGERFRDDFLAPLLRSKKHVIVDFDDAEGYGSSFLEEAFGGLVRIHNFDRETINNLLAFQSQEDPSIAVEARQYIDDALNFVRR